MGDRINQLIRKLLLHPAAHLALIGVVLFVVAWPIISPLTFISSDVGLRYLQIRSLVAQEWQTLAVLYPVAIDPDLAHVPYYYAYSVVNGRIFLNISPFFPIIAAALQQLAGMPGLVFSPIVGTLLGAWGTYKLVRATAVSRAILAMWAVVFATPLVFYSTLLWDHSLGTGVAIVGTAVLAHGMTQQDWRRTAVGGVILGISLGQRPELYLYIFALGIAWMITHWRQKWLTIALIVGLIGGAVFVWILQAIWVGHPLGMATAPHLFDYGVPDAFPIAPFGRMSRTIIVSFFLFYIRSRDPLTFSAALAVLLGMLLLFFALRVPRYRKTAVLWMAVLLITAAFTAWAIVGKGEPIIGLLSSFPLFAFSIAYVNRQKNSSSTHSIYNFLFLTTIIYFAAMLLLWPAFGGRMWGVRYMLTLYPLLIVFAFYGLHHHEQQKVVPFAAKLTPIFGVLLVVSVLYQAVGVRLNHAVVTSLAVNRDELANLPVDAILTTDAYTSAYMTSVENKTFFFVTPEDDLETLFTQMVAHDMQTFSLFPPDGLDLPAKIGDIQITMITENRYQLRQE
jgi:hypothetical protein